MRVLLAVLLLVPLAVADHPGVPARPDWMVAPGDELVHNVFTVDAKLDAWEVAYPGLVERFELGTSLHGLPLHGVVVTDESANPLLTTDGKLRVYLDGGHHGNEYLGVELIMYYLDALLADAAAGGPAATLLASTELHVVPILNPEGNLGDRRYNGRMVDLNRNYDFGWSGGCVALDVCTNGAAPHSEPEVAANVAYVAALDPDIWISTHTGIETLFWPQGNPDVPGDPFVPHAPDIGVFETMEVGFEEATNGRIDAYGGPAAALGSAEDYGYGVLGIPTFVYEVHNDQNIPAYGEPMTQVLADQLAGLQFLIDNAYRMGAWVQLTTTQDGLALSNHGWGPARNVTVTSDHGTLVVPDIAPGSLVQVNVTGAVSWSYASLLIDASRVRTHRAMVDTTTGGDSVESIPAPAFLLAVLAAALLGRRR